MLFDIITGISLVFLMLVTCIDSEVLLDNALSENEEVITNVN